MAAKRHVLIDVMAPEEREVDALKDILATMGPAVFELRKNNETLSIYLAGSSEVLIRQIPGWLLVDILAGDDYEVLIQKLVEKISRHKIYIRLIERSK